MSAAAAPAGPAVDPSMLECNICLALIGEPVTISCGHSFCRSCLEVSNLVRSYNSRVDRALWCACKGLAKDPRTARGVVKARVHAEPRAPTLS